MTTRFFSFLILLLASQTLLARELVIISDLDETLRIANVEKKVNAGLRILTGVRPYRAMGMIFNELKQTHSETKFYYLSNSYTFMYQADNWTSENGFPEGVYYQRRLKDESDNFKPSKLRKIIQSHPGAKFIFFGDNIERDPKFYREVVAETKLTDAEIYIRDARLIFPQEANITYFQTEAQIIDDLKLSPTTRDAIKQLPFYKLVPKFLLKNLRQRLVKSCKASKEDCRKAAQERIEEVIGLIHPLAD